jgi:hypothetical protein
MNKDNPQPSPNDDASAHLWMQFRDLMSVGQQRLEQRTNKLSMSWHKIKSVPLEIGSIRGITNGRYTKCKESLLGFIVI